MSARVSKGVADLLLGDLALEQLDDGAVFAEQADTRHSHHGLEQAIFLGFFLNSSLSINEEQANITKYDIIRN